MELKELIPVTTPLGTGYAIMVELRAHDNYWTVVLDDTCAIVTFRQEEIRAAASYTYGRSMSHERMCKAIGADTGNRTQT